MFSAPLSFAPPDLKANAQASKPPGTQHSAGIRQFSVRPLPPSSIKKKQSTPTAAAPPLSPADNSPKVRDDDTSSEASDEDAAAQSSETNTDDKHSHKTDTSAPPASATAPPPASASATTSPPHPVARKRKKPSITTELQTITAESVARDLTLGWYSCGSCVRGFYSESKLAQHLKEKKHISAADAVSLEEPNEAPSAAMTLRRSTRSNPSSSSSSS